MPSWCCVLRFIPACAGNIYYFYLAPCILTVHPRLRGEHQLVDGSDVLFSGSSPLARGTYYRYLDDFKWYRFIPACAGNISISTYTVDADAVHPRLRGEHDMSSRNVLGSSGSSPLARGTCERKRRKRQRYRFIPACAGNILQKG